MDSKNPQTRRRSARINSDNYAHVHLQSAKVATAAAGGSSVGNWPFVSLSKQEIEEDFFNLTGSTELRRPKLKRSKQVKNAISMISPGLRLRGKVGKRYEVKEKGSKKGPRGMKAMDNAMKRAMDDFIPEEDGDAELLDGLEEYVDYIFDVKVRAGLIS